MAAFTIMITNRGKALQAKAQTGVELKYTRFRVGDGQLGGRPISDLTGLINPVMSLPISKLQTRPGGRAVVGTVMTNKDVTTGFYFRELGIYAQDPDIGEILYCYGNAGETADYIPAKGGSNIIEEPIDISTIVGNASNVTAGIDESLVWATHDDVAKSLADSKAYTDQKVKDIDLSKITPDSIGAAKKADLDTLQKNSVSIKTSTSKDLNAYREPGLYFIGSLNEYANAPSSDGGFSWGILRVEALGTTAYVVQSYTCVLNNVTFTRSKAEDVTGRGWEPWRATSKLDDDGVLRLSKWLDIRGDAATINSYGKTHTYHAFLVNNDRVGYVGASDPNAPANMALVSDKADVVINAKNNVWLNASAGAVHLNGRNILWEIDQLKTSGVNAKQGTVDALNAKGQPASTNDEWPTLHQKIRQIYTGSPVARINIASSYDKRSFREHRSSNSGQSMYFVTVTGLGFRAKRIAIQSPTSSEFLAFYDEKWPNYVRCKNYRYGEYDYDMGVVLSDTFPEPNSNNGWWWQGAITPDGFLMPIGTDESNQVREVYVFAIG